MFSRFQPNDTVFLILTGASVFTLTATVLFLTHPASSWTLKRPQREVVDSGTTEDDDSDSSSTSSSLSLEAPLIGQTPGGITNGAGTRNRAPRQEPPENDIPLEALETLLHNPNYEIREATRQVLVQRFLHNRHTLAMVIADRDSDDPARKRKAEIVCSLLGPAALRGLTIGPAPDGRWPTASDVTLSGGHARGGAGSNVRRIGGGETEAEYVDDSLITFRQALEEVHPGIDTEDTTVHTTRPTHSGGGRGRGNSGTVFQVPMADVEVVPPVPRSPGQGPFRRGRGTLVAGAAGREEMSFEEVELERRWRRREATVLSVRDDDSGLIGSGIRTDTAGEAVPYGNTSARDGVATVEPVLNGENDEHSRHDTRIDDLGQSNDRGDSARRSHQSQPENTVAHADSEPEQQQSNESNELNPTIPPANTTPNTDGNQDGTTNTNAHDTTIATNTNEHASTTHNTNTNSNSDEVIENEELESTESLFNILLRLTQGEAALERIRAGANPMEVDFRETTDEVLSNLQSRIEAMGDSPAVAAGRGTSRELGLNGLRDEGEEEEEFRVRADGSTQVIHSNSSGQSEGEPVRETMEGAGFEEDSDGVRSTPSENDVLDIEPLRLTARDSESGDNDGDGDDVVTDAEEYGAGGGNNY